MLESGTISVENSSDGQWPDEFRPGYLLTRIKHPSPKPFPHEVFQVVVLTEHVRQTDLDTLFDQRDGVVLVPDGTTTADLMFVLGIFPSKGQARKNGWPGPIPAGWSELRAGRNLVFVWNPSE